ncbi:MAG: LysR family transcriptional regulator [Nibricoccus sp.]
MELRQLRYFVAVAEEGNISRAAQKIFLTQPALSRQIKALEEEFGQCLLERQAHSIKLTPAGEILLREARGLLTHADQVVEQVQAIGGGLRLRVGYAPSFAAGILATAVNNFTQTHPNAQVELFDLSTKEMLAGLEDDRLDIALTIRREAETRGLLWTPISRTAVSLAVGRQHPLARSKRIAVADLSREKFCIFRRGEYPEYWDAIGGWLRENGLRPKIAGEYDGGESMMAAVEAGLGVALLPTSIGRLFPERTCLLAIAPAPRPIDIYAGFRAQRVDDKPLKVFIEELRSAAKSLK